MEKYLVIFLIAIVGYVFWKCLNETNEGFGDVAQSVGGIDDQNAINTLAQVARDLQKDGLKIKGNLETTGKIKFMNKDGGDDSDPYYLEKVQKDSNNNHLRLTINDDADESFQIWGNSCGTGNCGGEGKSQHIFSANGNAEHAGNLTVAGSFNLLPRGVIVAWNGTTAPAGWAVCDGQNGTPDLRGRFIRSANGGENHELPMKVSQAPEVHGKSRSKHHSAIWKHDFGNFGGSDYVEMNGNELPTHTHQYWHRGRGCRDIRASGKDGCWMAGPEESTETTAPAGNGWGHNSQPPYYVLTYIMKL
jgi:microcystin-dependent protein